MTSKSEESAEARRAREYGFARVRDIAFDAVMVLWRRREAEGVRQADLAEKMGKDPGQLSRILSGPGNWTLKTFGELVEALDGEAEIIVHPVELTNLSSNFDAYAVMGAEGHVIPQVIERVALPYANNTPQALPGEALKGAARQLQPAELALKW